jgi:Tol biopolymer transport system component
VFDIVTGALTNLTDDGYAGSQDDAPDGIGVDFAPVWSPDGTEIIFARSVTRGDGSGRTALFRVSITGGEPREVVEAAAQPFAVMAGLRWLADDTILYSVSDRDGGPANGLWTVAAGGGGARQVVSERASGLDRPVLTAASPQGRALLTGSGLESAFALVDLATGQAERLEPVGEGATVIAAATLSPDGTRLLVSELHEAGIKEQHLVVHDLETGEWQELGTLDWLIGAIQRQGGLIWASNDLVFGTGGALTGLLVRLASG